MRSMVLAGLIVIVMSAPSLGLSAQIEAPASPWIAWYETKTGTPAPPMLLAATPALDEFLTGIELAPDEHPEVHAGWMRGYCDRGLHPDCTYNDPTGHTYNCLGSQDLPGWAPDFILWKAYPSVVMMNRTIYGTYTEGSLGLGWGGDARHAFFIGTGCHFALFNSTYVQMSGIGFFLPMKIPA